jgi:dihydrofolate reductase
VQRAQQALNIREDNQMRNVIFAINVTLDGCVDHTKFNPAEDLLEHYTRLLRDDAGVLVYGRKTYQLMVPYWPDIAKSQSETTPRNLLSSRDHWIASKEKIPELFVRTFTMKYLN